MDTKEKNQLTPEQRRRRAALKRENRRNWSAEDGRKES